MKPFFAALTLSSLLCSSALDAAEPTDTIVFVCEHGVAKSVIATTLFNKMASDRGLSVRAVSRGLELEPTLQLATREGLTRDGFDVSAVTPQALSAGDVQTAHQVITIGVAQEPDFVVREKLVEWDDVPAVSKDYELARTSLKTHVEALLQQLSDSTATKTKTEKAK